MFCQFERRSCRTRCSARVNSKDSARWSNSGRCHRRPGSSQTSIAAGRDRDDEPKDFRFPFTASERPSCSTRSRFRAPVSTSSCCPISAGDNGLAALSRPRRCPSIPWYRRRLGPMDHCLDTLLVAARMWRTAPSRIEGESHGTAGWRDWRRNLPYYRVCS